MRINSRAPSRFDVVAWDAIARQVDEWTAPHSPFMAEVVASVRASAPDRLVGFMSMHDLAVAVAPVPTEGSIEVIWVRPQPSGRIEDREVLVEHCSATGFDDRIVRHGSHAVALFWRFVIEKFGIEPNQPEHG